MPDRSDGMTSFGEQVDLWTRYWARLADPARRAVLDAIRVRPGTQLLDIGCGSGEFARLAVDRGATVSGVDVAPEMVDTSATAVPEGDFRVGDMSALPWPDATFDVVTAFNAFQFADEPVAPLREAARVRRPGGRIAICNWGPWDAQDNNVITDALKTLVPSVPPPRTRTVSPPGALEALAAAVGLDVELAGDVEVPWQVPDAENLLAAVMFNVERLDIEAHADRTEIERTVLEAAERFRRGDGSYRLENRWRYVVVV